MYMVHVHALYKFAKSEVLKRYNPAEKHCCINIKSTEHHRTRFDNDIRLYMMSYMKDIHLLWRISDPPP